MKEHFSYKLNLKIIITVFFVVLSQLVVIDAEAASPSKDSSSKDSSSKDSSSKDSSSKDSSSKDSSSKDSSSKQRVVFEKEFDEIHANIIKYNVDTVDLAGDVWLKNQFMSLYAENILFNKKTSELYLYNGAEVFFNSYQERLDTEVFFLDLITKAGYAENVYFSFSQGGSFSSTYMSWVDDEYFFYNSIFSQCPQPEGEDEITWIIKNEYAVLNYETMRVSFTNIDLLLWNTKIFALPYFSYPMPNTGNHTGWLTPQLRFSEIYGVGLEVPYYISLSPSEDITLIPLIASQNILNFFGEYRHVFDNGYIKSDFSISNNQEDHYDGIFRWHINDNIRLDVFGGRAGLDFIFTSDEYYLRDFKIYDLSVLENILYFDKFTSESYLSINFVNLKNLNFFSQVRNEENLLPFLRYRNLFLDSLGWAGSHLYFDNYIYNYDRGELKSKNLISRLLWDASYISSNTGLLSEFRGELRGNFYHFQTPQKSIFDTENEDYQNNIKMLSKLAMTLSYPLIDQSILTGNKYLISPKLQVAYSSIHQKANSYPDIGVELLPFTYNFLFENQDYAHNHLDYEGVRLNYGIETELHTYAGDKLSFAIGQRYYWSENIQEIPNNKTLSLQGFSDYTGQFSFLRGNNLAFNYNFTLGEESFNIKDQLLALKLIKDTDYFSLAYFSVVDDRYFHQRNLKQLRLEVSANISDVISLVGRSYIDVSNQDLPELISLYGGLKYEDECFRLLFWFKQDRRDRINHDNGLFSLGVELNLKSFIGV